MTTITINERTKAGKTLLELAKLLAVTNEGVSFDTEAEIASLSKKNELLADFELACKQLQHSKNSKEKRKSLEQLLDEK